MKVNISGLELKNPIIPASGTYGFGHEFQQFYDLKILGSIALKGATVEKRFGNQTPRIAEVEAGMINSIGLQNPSAQVIVDQDLVELEKYVDYQVIANVAGGCLEEYIECAKIMASSPLVGIIELNVSCPNVKAGGVHFGSDIGVLTELIQEVKKVVDKPVYVKLSPNVTDVVAIAKACEDAGCDGLVVINTLIGMKIDIYKAKPVIANKMGGLSGGCIHPVAVRMIYQIYQAVNIPIIGVGGISSAKDVVEMMMAGATAVQVGTANLLDPYACEKIINDLPLLVKELGYEKITELIGAAHE